MKSILRTAVRGALCALAACLSLAGCGEKPEIQRSYDFRVETLPVPKKLTKGQTAEIRCTLVRSGNYEGTKYSYRYFQSDGKGTLRMENGPALVPNDLYELNALEFRLYYTSASEEQQKLDIYFFDSQGKSATLSFSFNNENEQKRP